MTDETVEVKTAFFSGKVSSANLNTIFTVMGFVLTCLIAYSLWIHTTEAKDSIKAVATDLKESNKEVATALRDANKELAVSLREVTQATREQTCLLSIPQNERERNTEVCKRISR